MTETDRVPAPEGRQHSADGQARQAQTPSQPSVNPSRQPISQPETAAAGEIADAVLDRIGDKVADSRRVTDSRPPKADIGSVEQAIALREQAPEMYDLWLKIAKDKAATANYVERAPYEVPERLAQSGRPRALGALVIVLSFCGYLAWLGGPGLYIGGLIAILDLVVMFGMFFGLRPDRLPDPQEKERRPPPRGRLARSAGSQSAAGAGQPGRTILSEAGERAGLCGQARR
jgi:hypothetical protein